MKGREWRWWEEFEKADPTSEPVPDQHRRTERRNAIVFRWAVTVGWTVLAASKAISGAWLFAAAYAACAVGFFVALGIASRRLGSHPD